MITVYLDTETGGTKPEHPTIQLAAVAMDGDRELASFEQCIAFDIGASDPAALAMNHWDAARWAREAVTPEVCAAKFAAWLRPYQSVTLTSKRTGRDYTVARLAAYNAVTFDMPRLYEMFGDIFTPWERRVRDVFQRVLFWSDETGTELENYKLPTVATHFGIATDGAHGALADARMCAAVARAIREAW